MFVLLTGFKRILGLPIFEFAFLWFSHFGRLLICISMIIFFVVFQILTCTSAVVEKKNRIGFALLHLKPPWLTGR